MALTTPSTDALLLHTREEDWSPPEAEDWAVEALQAATDLMEATTNLHEDPADDLSKRVLKRGILEMAYAIFITDEDREALYSPFTSERIGSYSYQLKQGNGVDLGSFVYPTGIGPFDFAVAYLAGLDPDMAAIATTSEKVFERRADYPEIKSRQDYIDDGEIESPDVFGR